MRQTIRAAIKAGRHRVAVVCGAWHAPVLQRPTAAGEPGQPDCCAAARGARSRITWVPWTHSRLATRVGYGAGITSPGWYHHLWTAPDQPITRWLTKVARSLRARDLPVSSAHVIEAVRLAETLAGLRGRPLAGLTEVNEATRAVLCDGDEVAARFVTRQLVVGQATRRGRPTGADGAAGGGPGRRAAGRCGSGGRRARASTTSICAGRTTRRGRGCSTGSGCSTSTGSSPRAARSRRRHLPGDLAVASGGPSYAVAVVEAATWGTTVAAAATAKVRDDRRRRRPGRADRAVERCLLADLPEALDELLAALARAGRAGRRRRPPDGGAAGAGPRPALRRRPRHRHVRAAPGQRDAASVRICAGLPRRSPAWTTTAPARCGARIDGVHAAVALLRGRAGRGCARPSLAGHPGRDRRPTDVNGQLAGRVVRHPARRRAAERRAGTAARGRSPHGVAGRRQGGLGGRLLRRRRAAAHPRRRAARPARRLAARAGRRRVRRRAAAGPAHVRHVQPRRSAG